MQDNGSIQELPLSHPYFREKVEAFLAENGLRMDAGLERYYAVTGPSGDILAGAGIEADIIKCVAVSSSVRSEGFLLPLLSRIVSEAASNGILNLKVFTKPENADIFESLGFREIARAPKAILMENGRGLEKYCEYLSGICHASGSEKLFFGTVPEKPIFHCQRKPSARKCGVIVMNANPFTLGHKYLIEKALEQVDRLFIIPVQEDASAFPYPERLAMIRAAVMPGPHRASAQPLAEFSPAVASPAHADAGVTVLEGSAYCISAATFPTYFLKDLSDAAETQMRLDLDLFERHIMPALGASIRFVGSEPLDPLTARYNSLMHNAVEIPRLEASALPSAEENYFSGRCPKNQFSPAVASPTHADAISASKVRAAIEAGDFAAAAALCPSTSWPYLLAALAERALLIELNTPLKPGLVGPDGPGAHKDMDYNTMLRGIKALRPFWSRMAMASGPDELRSLGIEAEEAMMAATGGVNTHRGAIFCIGIVLNAAVAWRQQTDIQELMQKRLPEIAQTIFDNQLINNNIAPRRDGIKDARAMALDGYSDLFTDWLPYYRRLCHSDDLHCHSERSEESPARMTLLRIMSTLDDTCVIKRVGYDRAQEVKREAAASLTHADALKALCARYAQEGISPGGAADMLALTIFIDSII